MVAQFHVEVDQESGTFKPVDLHIRMEHHRSDGTEVAVEMELVSVAMDREGLVTLTPKAPDSDEPILVYEVQLTDALLSSPDFASQITEPIRVTFTARPKPESPDAAPPEPLEQRCDIIIDSPGAIHWTVADDPTTRDQPVELDADGQSEFVLSVRYEAWDPEQRQVVYKPEDVEFSHWTGPGLDPDVFGPVKGDEPWVVAGVDNNRDHSRWDSKLELPHPSHPGLTLPFNSSIRVRVWPMGSVVRHPGSISFKEGAKLLAEADVPLTLLEARQLVDLVRPEEPVPADGQEHELVLRFLRERDRSLVKRGTYSFEFEPGEHHRGGKIAETEAELTEDAKGELTLTYTAPELTYEAGKSFTERLQVYRGVGDDRQLLATIPVHLSPKVELRVEPEKAGLTWEPFELTIDPGLAPAVLRGVLTIDVTDKVEGDTKPFRVAHAKVMVHTGPGQSTKVELPLRSDKDGRWEWKLPELAEGLAKLPVERRERTLDPDSDRPESRFDDEAETVIRFYEDKVHEHTPWPLYDSPLERRIRQHRLVYGEQLASNPEHLLDRAVSGTDLLRAGTTFGKSYERIYESQIEVAAGGLNGIFTELIGLAINAASIGEKVGKVVGKVAALLDEVAGSVARGIGRYVTTEFAVGLKVTAIQIMEFLGRFTEQTTSPTVWNMIEGVKGAWAIIAETASNLITRQGSALVELVSGAINLLMNALKAIGNLVVTAVLLVLTAGGALLGMLIDALGSLLSRCAGPPVERLIATVGHYLTGTSAASAEVGKWTVGKAFEELYKATLDRLAGAQRAAGGVASSVASVVNPMGWVTSPAVGWLDGEAERLWVPEDAEPRIDEFRDDTLALGETQAAVGKYSSYLEIALGFIDAIVLAIECILMLLSMFVSAGFLNPVTLGPAMTAFEISFAKAKLAFIRLPALGLNLVGAVMIAGLYGLRVWSLPGPVTAPNLAPQAASP